MVNNPFKGNLQSNAVRGHIMHMSQDKWKTVTVLLLEWLLVVGKFFPGTESYADVYRVIPQTKKKRYTSNILNASDNDEF